MGKQKMKSFKSLAIVTCVLILFAYTLCNEVNNESNSEAEMDKIGESSNLNNKADMAVAFAIGKVHTDQYYLENSSDFKSVKIVKKLPKRKEIKGKLHQSMKFLL